ncbi:MAG: hypothetical protein A2W93_10030 [Bacteroidetes bacterium GWF2_43_63]|nr:MAG: hypothetical protein A2W94_02440 [Bacteroidetes bacterium GWE2_42_42]OFY52861.1 MAG: hypothetical protein A2W93_10030 [Bacteroidetes bacterium GWF2_43_63]
MEKTLVIGNSKLLNDLGGAFIELPSLNNEIEMHNWIVDVFRKKEIEKVVIEIADNPILSLKIGYHIRLSIEDLNNRSLVPILFICKLSLNTLIIQTTIFSHILSTKGVSFSEYNLQENKAEIDNLVGINESEFKTRFLDIIHIQPDETVGRHSLANIWGAYSMDKASNANALQANSEFKKSLYFKYVSAFNNLSKLKPTTLKILGKINVGSIKKIEAINKRILLIDDEADKGWELVLRKVFNTSCDKDFIVIKEKVKDFDTLSEESKRIIKSEKFDLYLVDLRLNGLDEETNNTIEAFSGMKMLKEIKSINNGNQVIIFTASNKSWNLKSLFDAGADGYYMKESPEYNFSKAISEQNYIDFKESAEKCFKKNYLSAVYIHWRSAKEMKSNLISDFIIESDTSLTIAWKLIYQEYLDFGYLILFQIIESYADSLFQSDESGEDCKINDIIVIKKIGDNKKEWALKHMHNGANGDYFTSREKVEQHATQKPTALFKASCMLYFKYKKDDVFLQNFGKLNRMRNDIAHGKGIGIANHNKLIELLKIIKEIREK